MARWPTFVVSCSPPPKLSAPFIMASADAMSARFRGVDRNYVEISDWRGPQQLNAAGVELGEI